MTNYRFEYGRSIAPTRNPDIHIADNIKEKHLHEYFEPETTHFKSMDEGYGRGDKLLDQWLDESAQLPQHGMPLYRQAIKNGIDAVVDAPNSLKALFSHVEARPEWANNELMLIGSTALARYPIIQSLILQSVSLMGGYSVPGLAQPLLETKALSKSVVPRIARTLAFTAAVTIPNGLQDKGVGYRQALNVRLIHGLVRKRIIESDTWDTAYFGLPINQTDLVATNMMFSLTVIHGLATFGCQVSKTERAGILHLWRYTAHLLGIDDDLMPKSEEEANAWLYTYLATQKMDAKSAQPLARSLHELPLLIDPSDRKHIAKIEQSIRSEVTRMYWGDKICDELGLPNPRWTQFGLKGMKGSQTLAERLQSHVKPLEMVLDKGAEKYKDIVKTKYLAVKPDLKPTFDEIASAYEQYKTSQSKPSKAA